MIVYHGSSIIVKEPKIIVSKYPKDFGAGFYCTINYDQAKRWAKRNNSSSIVNYYEYNKEPSLNILNFSEVNNEWLDFIVKCRTGVSHNYDIIEGPMADDTIWNFVNDYIAGNIPRSVFFEYAKFKHPTHQINFSTARSLDCLKYLKYVNVCDLK